MVPTPAAVPESADPDDLVVIIAPEDACDGIDADAAHWLAHLVDDEKRNTPELADVAQLRAEITRLEQELERKEAHLEAVVTRNEQILAERTRSYQEHLAELDAPDGDDVLWNGRRHEWDGPLVRAKRWMRGLLP